MYRVKGYKVVKHGYTWFVLNEYDNATRARTLCLYSASTFLQCKNWIQERKVWFKKSLTVGIKTKEKQKPRTKQKEIERLKAIGERIGFYN